MTNHVSSEDEIVVTTGGDPIGHSLQRAQDPVSKSSSAKQRLPAMAIGDSRPAVEHPNMGDEPIINGVVRASSAECCNAKKRKNSGVWDHFTEDVPNKKAYCNYCGKSLRHTSNYGTSSLRKHLKKCPAKTGTEKGQTQLAANEVAGSSKEMIVTKFDEAQSREDISRYIVMCGVPFRTVEHPAFRVMLKNLQPLFMPNNGPAALRDAIQLYNKGKKILQDVLLKVKGRISLTASVSTCEGEGFMIITAHYTDDEWELKSRVINVRYLGMGGIIADDWCEIQRNLNEWGITDKLFSVVLDRYARDDVIPSTFKEQCESSLPLGGRFFLIGCSAFDIDLIVDRFRKSGSISRINDAIGTELCNFQKVVRDSRVMSAESFTSVADVSLYKFCMFGSHFRKDRVSSLTKEIMEVMHFNQCWDDYCIMLSIVVVFDPRKKLDFVKFCFSKAYGETATKYVDDVNNSLANLFIWYKEKLRLQPQSNVPNDDGNGPCIALVSNNQSNVLHEFHRFKQNENRSQPPESELDSYLKEEAHPHKANFNILKWWQLSGSKYPTLAVMARDMLAIPLSTKDSILDLRGIGKRFCLVYPTVEALVCLKDWLRQSDFSTSGLCLDDPSVDKHCDSSGEES